MIGFNEQTLKRLGESLLNGYEGVGTILFVNSHNQKEIV